MIKKFKTSILALIASALVFDSYAAQYTVKKGDTFSKIADQKGVSLNSIIRNNPNVNPKKLKIGQIINYGIPVKQDPLFNDQVLRDELLLHEGFSLSYYPDSKKIPTIGIGFNLEKPGARVRIQNLDLDYDKVLSGKQSLTTNQVFKLFNEDLEDAIESAKDSVKTFNCQPIEIKRVIVNMVYNLGEQRFSEFSNTISYINKKDYKNAALEMRNSDWYHDVKNRSKYLISKVETIASIR